MLYTINSVPNLILTRILKSYRTRCWHLSRAVGLVVAAVVAVVAVEEEEEEVEDTRVPKLHICKFAMRKWASDPTRPTYLHIMHV